MPFFTTTSDGTVFDYRELQTNNCVFSDMLKQVLSFPPDTVSEFKDHDLSIQGVIEHESSHKNKGHKAIKHQGDDTSKQAAQGS